MEIPIIENYGNTFETGKNWNRGQQSALFNWIWILSVQYSGDLKSDHLKSGNIWNLDFLRVGFQMVLFSNGLGLAMAMVPTIWKLDHLKSRHFCSDFKWLLTKWQPFVQISNECASGFQTPFKIQTICNPTSVAPFKIQTRLDFRSPLYWTCWVFWSSLYLSYNIPRRSQLRICFNISKNWTRWFKECS